jgi:hypothetical protein
MNAQPRSSTILKLEPNVPTELALQYPTGLNVNGQFGPQVLFTLTNNRRLYVPEAVGREIAALTLAPGQAFIITKSQERGQKRFDWKVDRKPVQPSEMRANPVSAMETATQIEHALKTAVAAAASAERFATEIGYTVRFSEESIRAMGITILIGMRDAA